MRWLNLKHDVVSFCLAATFFLIAEWPCTIDLSFLSGIYESASKYPLILGAGNPRQQIVKLLAENSP